MKSLHDLLQGGDLRSIGKANEVVQVINNQKDFDLLFPGLFSTDRKVIMRTADAIEKITLDNPRFLFKYKKEILHLCIDAKYIELKWHLALLISRLELTLEEIGKVWQLLTEWATNKKESKIVRVNSVQGLYELLQRNRALEQDYKLTLHEILKENIPSLNA